jgi:hypothetical protein
MRNSYKRLVIGDSIGFFLFDNLIIIEGSLCTLPLFSKQQRGGERVFKNMVIFVKE